MYTRICHVCSRVQLNINKLQHCKIKSYEVNRVIVGFAILYRGSVTEERAQHPSSRASWVQASVLCSQRTL